MKKLILPICIILLLSGCEEQLYTVSIKNNSTKTARYSYNNLNETLNSGESKTYEGIKAYQESPKNLVDQNGIASLKFEQDHMTGDYAIENKERMIMTILNTLPVDVKRIKADNYISYNGSYLIDVVKNSTLSDDDLFIYTKTPNFSLAPDTDGKIELAYPITFEWSVTNNKMFVTIR